MAGVNLI